MIEYKIFNLLKTHTYKWVDIYFTLTNAFFMAPKAAFAWAEKPLLTAAPAGGPCAVPTENWFPDLISLNAGMIKKSDAVVALAGRAMNLEGSSASE